MAGVKTKLLIVEDGLDIAVMLNASNCVQGYDALLAAWGEDGVPTCQAAYP
jgi:hypothetical protein